MLKEYVLLCVRNHQIKVHYPLSANISNFPSFRKYFCFLNALNLISTLHENFS